MIPFGLQKIKQPEWVNFRVSVERLSSEYTLRKELAFVRFQHKNYEAQYLLMQLYHARGIL